MDGFLAHDAGIFKVEALTEKYGIVYSFYHFQSLADLAYGDLRAYLSGQVCGVFVGLCAGADIYDGQALSIISGLPWQACYVKKTV